MKIDIKIDKNTPCLKNLKTEEIVQTTFLKANKRDLINLQEQGWNFNWADEQPENFEIYKLIIKNNLQIQGLIAIQDYPKDRAVYINIVESAPHNLGDLKIYEGVGGHLFAIAAKISKEKGYGGFIFMDAKNEELVEHYKKTLGAIHLGGIHPYRMVIEEEDAVKLLHTYSLED